MSLNSFLLINSIGLKSCSRRKKWGELFEWEWIKLINDHNPIGYEHLLKLPLEFEVFLDLIIPIVRSSNVLLQKRQSPIFCIPSNLIITYFFFQIIKKLLLKCLCSEYSQ